MCGAISQYDSGGHPVRSDLLALLGSGTTMTWFSIYDYMHHLDDFVARMAQLVRDGLVVSQRTSSRGSSTCRRHSLACSAGRTSEAARARG